MAWVPKPDKKTNKVSQIPSCWVECDGSYISSGIWSGLKTPELNNAERFLRGGTPADALETQEDSLQNHHHHVDDKGHQHRYNDRFWDNLDRTSTKPLPDWGSYAPEDNIGDQHNAPHDYYHTHKSKSYIAVKDVKNGRFDSETRPKNMKVTFIMKVC